MGDQDQSYSTVPFAGTAVSLGVPQFQGIFAGVVRDNSVKLWILREFMTSQM